MKALQQHFTGFLQNPRLEILAGLTVALALVPEAIAFAFVAGVEPLIGLFAAVFMAFIPALLGGRPGMISGATGATAVVMTPLVAMHGLEYLFAAVVLCGLIQIGFGLLKWGKFAHLIPLPVMIGFVNGLALVIGYAQLKQFQNVDGSWLSLGELWPMALTIALVMGIMWGLPKVGKLGKLVPAGLAAIVVASLLSFVPGLGSKTVGQIAAVSGSFPAFGLPQVPWDLGVIQTVLPYALVLAGVGIIESLMTLMLVDEITETRGRPNREAMAQGLANTVSGLFGTMGGCAMIGQTMINVGSGARGRLSGIAAALFLLSFILFLGSWIEQIPVSALIGVMFMVVIGTFEWSTFKIMRRVPKSDVLVIVAVTVITLLTDLAVAVLSGVVISALVFAYQSATRLVVQTRILEDGTKEYRLIGSVFFGSIKPFKELFDVVHDPKSVIVDFAQAKVYDHSGVDGIHQISQKYRALGKTLHLRHLSEDCALLLTQAGDLVEVNVLEDPKYRVAEDRLDS